MTALANSVGIAPSRMSMIETGQRPASRELAQKIADELCVPLEDVFLPDSFTVRESKPATTPDDPAPAGVRVAEGG